MDGCHRQIAIKPTREPILPSRFEYPSVPTEEIPLTGNPFDPEQRGWLIGIGGQYTVHDIGHGRVAKTGQLKELCPHALGRQDTVRGRPRTPWPAPESEGRILRIRIGSFWFLKRGPGNDRHHPMGQTAPGSIIYPGETETRRILSYHW